MSDRVNSIVSSNPSSQATAPVLAEKEKGSEATIVSRYAVLFNNKDMSDVSFVFKSGEGQEVIFGHKLILGVASRVFHKMFYDENFPKSSEIVMSPELLFDRTAFWHLLKFLYTDTISFDALSVEDIVGILQCSDFYDIPRLRGVSCQELQKKLNKDNVTFLLETAEFFKEDVLAESALYFIDQNPKEVFGQESILQVKRDTLLHILQRDTLVVDEPFVFDLAFRWASAECTRTGLKATYINRRNVLGDVFFEIRFSLLHPSAVQKVIATSLLTEKELLDLLLHIQYNGKVSTIEGAQAEHFNSMVSSHASKFKTNDRAFGKRKKQLESENALKLYEEQRNARRTELQQLSYWKSIAKTEANLFMKGFNADKTEGDLEDDLEAAGYGCDLLVTKIGKGRRTSFHVQFLYNPSLFDVSDFLTPGFLLRDESIQVALWVDRAY